MCLILRIQRIKNSSIHTLNSKKKKTNDSIPLCFNTQRNFHMKMYVNQMMSVIIKKSSNFNANNK